MNSMLASQDHFSLAFLPLDDEAFVRRAYRRVLNREAEPAGLQACLARLRSGVSRERILADLGSSPEGRLAARRAGVSLAATAVHHPPADVEALLKLADDHAFLHYAFSLVLGRAADADGLAQMKQHLSAGGTRAEILRSLARSEEGLAYKSGLAGLTQWIQMAPESDAGDVYALLQIQDRRAFVLAAYWHVLGRPADTSGLQRCESFLAAGASHEKILYELATSEEGSARGTVRLPGFTEWLQAQTTGGEIRPQPLNHVNELLKTAGDEVFLWAAYWHVLGRPIDPHGAKTYGTLLRQGWSRHHVMLELSRSDEGRSSSLAVPGMQAVLRQYVKAQRRSWSGWYRRNVLAVESDLPADRRLRAVHCALTIG